MRYPEVSISGNGASLRFVLTEGFSEGYANRIEGMEWQTTHPMYFWWTGGSFNPIPFTVTLFVNNEGDITTSAALVAVVESTVNAALCKSPAGGSMYTMPQQAVTLKVSDWWQRTGYLQDMSVDWKPPWDLDNGGRPMVAVLHFTFISDWMAYDTTTKEFWKLPSRSNFHFDGTTGSPGAQGASRQQRFT